MPMIRCHDYDEDCPSSCACISCTLEECGQHSQCKICPFHETEMKLMNMNENEKENLE
jgi:hypothetical protein